MRNIVCFILLSATLSCSDKHPVSDSATIAEEKPTYDTAAIDSFSPGATTVDVAAAIRRASKQYQDSLRAAAAAAETEKKAASEKAKLEAELKKEVEKKSKQDKRSAETDKTAELPKAQQEENNPTQNL